MKSQSFIKIYRLGFLGILFFSLPLMAEYRVYQYYVTPTLSSPKDNTNYLVTSTLDPVTYVSYHGGTGSIKVDLLRTWTCEGYTGGQHEYCDSPMEEGKLDRGTASEGVGL